MRLFCLVLFVGILIPEIILGQSKSITHFRSDFKEDFNVFFYSSTLKMLNKDNDPELAAILDEIEEIKVLNYNKQQPAFKADDLTALKNALDKESYKNIMMVKENGNSIQIYNREKKGKTYGFVAIIENTQSLVLIDLIGSIDIQKFLALQKKIPFKTDALFNNRTN